MNRSARVLGMIGAAGLVVPVALVVAIQPAAAHGAMDSPVSRSYVCYQEGPENPTSEVCRAVVEAGGPQPLYDWMEVNIADAAGRHREIIPDGELCSAGREKYAGLDLARDDWPTTSLSSGAEYTFRYRATAPHQGGFELYVTKDGYDPTQPLGWDDVEAEPFLSVDDPELVDGFYLMPGHLPDKSGRHVIYAIWQRSDSPEAFYACSDVVFDGDGDGGGGGGGGGGGDPTPPPDPEPTDPPDPEPTETPSPDPTGPPELPDDVRDRLFELYLWLSQWFGDDQVGHAGGGTPGGHGAHGGHGAEAADLIGTEAIDDVVDDATTSVAASSPVPGQPLVVGIAAVLFAVTAVMARPSLVRRRQPSHRQPSHRRLAAHRRDEPETGPPIPGLVRRRPEPRNR